MIPDIAKVTSLLREAAETFILPRFERLAADDVQEKGPGDLVTIADLETERALTPRLMDLLPGSVVVGEEAVAQEPRVLARLQGEAPVWLLDPIDGTLNFAAGKPLFAVMVALVEAGRTRAAWIHDPIANLTATALEGGGAWCAGRRLQVAATSVPDPGPDAAPSLRYGNRHLMRHLAGRSPLVDAVFSYHCAGQEYMALASGRTHFAFYRRLMPWDHAPGVLIHREAGGFGRRLDGSDYSPRSQAGGLLLAPDEASWVSLQALLAA
jgi:fructose-1,6-bisphosphatase/inositol monophosphatase family enzyme